MAIVAVIASLVVPLAWEAAIAVIEAIVITAVLVRLGVRGQG
jgi:hypothetical protein